MLMIVMHNNPEYLNSLIQLAKKEGIANATIIEGENIGSRLVGEDVSFIFHKGSISKAYDKAFIAVIKGEDKTKHFLEVIENDFTLRWLNVEDRGFICTVPFQQIKYLELESSKIKKEGLKMKVANYLKEDRILLNLKATNKEEAIKEIANVLKEAEEISDFDVFLKDVFERESLSTTGIGNYIAIPHARSEAIKEFVIAFGRSSVGVEFNSLDGKPARLIFLMGTPKEKEINNYLKILAHLTRLLQKEDFREALLKAASAQEIIEEFKKIEH
jgi:fructose-specific phosphotransferase system IIA component